MRGAVEIAKPWAGLLLGAYVLYTLATGLGALHWGAELLTHFRLQASLGGSLLALACAGLRMPLAAGAAAALTVIHVAPLAPYLARTAEPAPDGPRLRLLELNVHMANAEHEAVERLVLEAEPDLVALFEVDRRWLRALAGLHARYPHRIEHPRHDNFGIALFSRFPLEELSLHPLHDDDIRWVLARFTLGSTPVAVIAAHPVPPVGATLSALRDAQLRALSQRVRELRRSAEVVLIGDLNTSPWSPAYRALEHDTDLRNGARGRGLLPTWPAAPAHLRPFMIPLDHVLLSPGLRVLSLETGPQVGSDHLPVLAEIAPRTGVVR